MENEALTIVSAMIDTGGHIIEIPLRLVGEISVDLLLKICSTLWYAGKQSIYVENTTRRGACSLDYLMTKRGTELQYCRIPEELKEKFLKDLETRGCLYTVLPDLNTEDDYFEIAFHTTDTPKVNAGCIKYHIGETQDTPLTEGIIGMADYVTNASPEKMGIIEANYEKELQKEKKVDAPGEYTLTINKETLLAGESGTHYFTYVPGTYDRKAGGFRDLLAVPKDKSEMIHDGQSIKYTLNLDDIYTIHDGIAYKNNGEIKDSRSVKGDALAHYYNHSRKGKTATERPVLTSSPETKVLEEGKSAIEKGVENYQKTNYKRAAGFQNFNQRQYDYGAMEIEFVHRLQKESQIQKEFTDDDIQYVTDKYYLLRPNTPGGAMLILPKEDVTYNSDNHRYEVVLKDKSYGRMSEKQFMSGDVSHPGIINKKIAAEHMEALDALKTSEHIQEAVHRVKSQAPSDSRDKVIGKL